MGILDLFKRHDRRIEREMRRNREAAVKELCLENEALREGRDELLGARRQNTLRVIRLFDHKNTMLERFQEDAQYWHHMYENLLKRTVEPEQCRCKQ